MNLKKYLLIDTYYDHDDDLHKLKLKVVNGFTRDDVETALDVQKGWTPLGGSQDRLYFFPGSNVPRFKVREHYSCTIKPEYATAAFLSKDSVEGSDSTLDHYKDCMPIEDIDSFTDWMEDIRDYHTALKFASVMGNGNIEGIMLSKKLWHDSAWQMDYHTGNERISDIHGVGSRYSHKNDCHGNDFQLLGFNKKSGLNNLTGDIFFEDDLLSILNNGNFVIGPTKYQELRNFGLTGEVENQVLMMELMSNCDFEKSVVHLLFLLKEFGSTMTSMKESEHVNFKSLLSFLKISQRKLGGIGINDMTRILRDHKQFTKTNALTVSMLFAGEYMDYSNTNNVCWMEGPVLREDCKTLLNDD